MHFQVHGLKVRSATSSKKSDSAYAMICKRAAMVAQELCKDKGQGIVKSTE
jgi:hypothetical protein